jgi:NAD-dependent dihydropyrimidine dehydrogenase PreA subunit
MRRGMGKGMGRGRGRGMRGLFGLGPSPSWSAMPKAPENERAILKEQAEALARQLDEIQRRLRQLEGTGPTRTAAIVDPELCTGCGACVEACPNGAIGLREGKAFVVERDCMMCGSCVDLCPEHAIILP